MRAGLRLGCRGRHHVRVAGDDREGGFGEVGDHRPANGQVDELLECRRVELGQAES